MASGTEAKQPRIRFAEPQRNDQPPGRRSSSGSPPIAVQGLDLR